MDALKYYLVSSSPELALDIGLNLVRGMNSRGRIVLLSFKNKRVGMICELHFVPVIIRNRDVGAGGEGGGLGGFSLPNFSEKIKTY